MELGFDTSELQDLAAMLDRARARPPRERNQALDRVIRKVAQTAKANAPVESGELRDSISVGGNGGSRTVSAPVRQAWFLEFGSPTTGGPRPWLSEPARQGAKELITDLGKIGEIW